MTQIKHIGVRQKMIVVLMVVLMLALGTTSVFTYQQQEQDIVDETNRRGEDLARFIAETVVVSVIGYDYHSIQFILEQIVKTKDVVYVRVDNKKGNAMAEVGVKPSQDANWLTFQRTILFDTENIGNVTLGIDNSRIIANLNAQASSLVIREAVIILVIAVGEFLALSFLIVRPVQIISRSLANGVDEEGRILEDIPLDSSDEFGILANLFNSMRRQLNDVNQRLQSRIESADIQLRENNMRLMHQSEELQQINVELKRLTVTDPLTGLYNRREFQNIMETDLALSLRHGEVSSLIIVDIDLFKQINDTYGHKVGDRVLVDVAKLLKVNLRKTDTVCRIGGEEFVALCRRAGEAEAILVGEKIRERIQAHTFGYEMRDFSVTVSIGIESLSAESKIQDTDEVFRRADAALYFSKQNGRNLVSHYNRIKDKLT